MDNFLLVYVVPILGAAIVLLAWHYGVIKGIFKPRVVRQEKKEGKEGEPDVMVRVYDCARRRIYKQGISVETANKIIDKHGSLGRQLNRYGEKIYALQFKDGEYSPAPISASQVAISPREIGEDLAIGYSIYLFYRPELGMPSSNNLKQLLWWSGVVAFIIFMIVAN